ncbi:MAG: hypothetical protein ACM3O9_03960 [Methylocystaceae bacterium]
MAEKEATYTVVADKQGFKMEWGGSEEHWMLPELTALVSVQSIYEVLFQYLITEEKEKLLTAFARKVEYYLEHQRTDRGNGPFSMPVAELEFLEEGIEELRYLQWYKVPVYLAKVFNNNGDTPSPQEWDDIEMVLGTTMIYNRRSTDDYSNIYLYPAALF